ncbi:MAG TPA: GGDEF domain-containing protein [Terricaulis sp.]|nr:GGDEF domain-containing protein [Terricaulis sp.]
MFSHLRLKLTFLYAGLFFVALTLIGAITYAVVDGATARMARAQLDTASAMFERTARLRTAQLQEGAARAAEDAALRSALAAGQAEGMRARLSALRARLQTDRVFLVTAGGLMIGEDGSGVGSVPPGLQSTLARQSAPSGVLQLDGALYRAVTAPLEGAEGWVLVADALDIEELDQIGALAAIPLEAELLTRAGGDWTTRDAIDRDAVNEFIQRSESGAHDAILTMHGERAVGVAAPLAVIDGAPVMLLLRYPLSSALSPYRALFNSLIAIGVVGLALVVVATWLLARGITQPLSTLEAAARNLREGVYEPVTVRTRDELSRLAASFNAMIDTIREREKRITHLAYHDTETRLHNRLALERRLAAATQPARLYLAAIGVDRFADVRGAIGYAHAGGLIRRLGARLARLAPNGPMARLSSDTLGIAFIADSEEEARKRADALISHLEQPIDLEGQVVDVNITIGIAQPRGREETPAQMIERASIGLDQARAARVKASFFDEAAYGDPARNLSLMGEMRRALASGDISLAHQAKYNFRTGKIDSVEALVRWRHPTRGMISPDLFVPMAEETGHVRAMTDWVLERAIEEQRAMAAAGWPLAVSLNISGRLLGDQDFASAALAAARAAQGKLCFEITETALIDNPKQALKNIERFAAAGVRVAIDDYGSGLSSLAYLKQMPAHELKIDKMFVQNITANERDALLVRSTIDLAHGLGLYVTAEGVETPAAFALLAHMGCDMAQGYLVARPTPLHELLALLKDTKRLHFFQQTAAMGASTPALNPIAPMRAEHS